VNVYMKPLVFIDRYWQSHQPDTIELHKFAKSLPMNDFRELASLLKLEVKMRGDDPYYIVPSTTGIREFKEANKIIQWPKMPKKLPRTKLTRTKVNPKFRTVYEYEHFIFADVGYSNWVAGGYELSTKDANRIYAILEQMKRVSYSKLNAYLLQNRDTYPYRNGKIDGVRDIL
jgi:hypothetical protein